MSILTQRDPLPHPLTPSSSQWKEPGRPFSRAIFQNNVCICRYQKKSAEDCCKTGHIDTHSFFGNSRRIRPTPRTQSTVRVCVQFPHEKEQDTYQSEACRQGTDTLDQIRGPTPGSMAFWPDQGQNMELIPMTTLYMSSTHGERT